MPYVTKYTFAGPRYGTYRDQIQEHVDTASFVDGVGRRLISAVPLTIDGETRAIVFFWEDTE